MDLFVNRERCGLGSVGRPLTRSLVSYKETLVRGTGLSLGGLAKDEEELLIGADPVVIVNSKVDVEGKDGNTYDADVE